MTRLERARSADFERLEKAGLPIYPDRYETTFSRLGHLPREPGRSLAVAGRVKSPHVPIRTTTRRCVCRHRPTSPHMTYRYLTSPAQAWLRPSVTSLRTAIE
jgi:hypothetical protein